MKLKKNKTAAVLAIGLVLMLLGSILAQAFHTSFYSVNVSRVYFDTESGTLSGLLYMPKGAGASDPRPTLVTTHGYLNSAEMQDAPAIEMSRRGYVVLALDMYDHGHSKGNAEHTGAFFSFWPTAIWDAVQYMYQQDYVLKDADGNGVLAVSGHSMGGFSSTAAVYYDELAYQQTGVRMIKAQLSAGADYMWTSYLGLDAATGAANFGGRTIGKICAHYDEFFFNAPGDEGTVNYKDYVSTVDGQIILETISYDADGNAVLDPNTKSDTWYQTSDGGQRIIYEPSEIHPWNHFSKGTTANMISFYETAFAEYSAKLNPMPANSQIWMFKEAFELVALVGFFLFLAALILLLVKAPFLSQAVTERPAPLPGVSTLRGKVGTVVLFLVTMLIPAIIYTAGTGEASRWLGYAAILAAVSGVIGLVMTLLSGEASQKKTWTAGSIVVIVSGLLMLYMVKKGIPNDATFQGPTVSTIVTWAIICACIAAVVMTAVYLFGNKKEQGVGIAHYGISGGAVSIAAAFCTALIAVVAGFACVFLVDIIFKVDFRIWTFAFKTFEVSAVPAALKYMPLFLIYYAVAGMACVYNTSSEKLQGAWGYVLAALTNMGGIFIWLVLQYGKLFITGSAFYPNEALSGILLFALVPTLAIASCLTKLFYKKTGNIWTAVFFNTMLMTMMTVANTTVYFQM
ncbi:MAG: alpha/beta hydrolase [Oscillospiraceae bacterium]|nr:alpha/beta hydrolase [Oscillospiraceae bacterium]